MHACSIQSATDLVWREVPTPTPGLGEVRVRVHAAGVNRADVLQCAGKYPAPPGWPSDIPGLEYAGEVDALGAGVTGLSLGDRVYGLVGGGAFAEQLVVHHQALARAPEGLSWTELAALPEAYLTAYDALVLQAGARVGSRVLVHAVGSGVGTAALQIGCALGASVMGTARSQAKLRSAQALGLHDGICVQDALFCVELKARAFEPDVVLDLVGGDYVAESLRALAVGGTLMLVGLTGGRECSLDLGTVLRKRARIIGTVMRSRGLAERIMLHRVLEKELGAWFASGVCKPVVSETFGMRDAAHALARLASNETFGKVVLRNA